MYQGLGEVSPTYKALDLLQKNLRLAVYSPWLFLNLRIAKAKFQKHCVGLTELLKPSFVHAAMKGAGALRSIRQSALNCFCQFRNKRSAA